MGARDMPRAEVDIDEGLVASLLTEQHPDLADRPLEVVAHGWDNVLVRLGDDLAVRLPRRIEAAGLVEHEHRWLPQLAPRLPLPIPAPVRFGRPAANFPWSWSVVPWFAGETALTSAPDDPASTAASLGRFLAALHRPAPQAAPSNPYRGVPLTDREVQFRANLGMVGADLDHSQIATLWDELRTAPPWDGPPLWVHGDVHPGNLIVDGGELTAVIDFGDLCAGDRASDLVVAWMLFDADTRPAFRAAAGAELAVDDATWQRARAWALALGVAIRANSADNPAYAAFATRTVRAVLARE